MSDVPPSENAKSETGVLDAEEIHVNCASAESGGKVQASQVTVSCDP